MDTALLSRKPRHLAVPISVRDAPFSSGRVCEGLPDGQFDTDCFIGSQYVFSIACLADFPGPAAVEFAVARKSSCSGTFTGRVFPA